jgi:ATP-dependent protease ClpP protease subunit
MPDDQLKTESSKAVETDAEPWRGFAPDIGIGQSWFHVLHRDGICHVSLFGDLGCGEHWTRLGDEIGGSKEIHLRIDSEGGDCGFAMRFFDAYGDGRVKECRIERRCFSAAVLCALAAKKIVMVRTARMMMHAPQSFVYGPASKLESRAKSLHKISERWFSILKVRTELPDEIISSWLDGSDVHLSAEQCLAYSLCDCIESAPAPAVATAPIPSEPPPAAAPVPLPYTPSENFLLDTVIPSLGTIETNDKARLAQELTLFLSTVKDLSKETNKPN